MAEGCLDFVTVIAAPATATAGLRFLVGPCLPPHMSSSRSASLMNFNTLLLVVLCCRAGALRWRCHGRVLEEPGRSVAGHHR